MKRYLIALSLALAACASSSGVMDTGSGTFFLSRQGATGLSSILKLKVAAIKEATAYCQKKGLTFKMTSMSAPDGPYVAGNFPHVDLQFSCTPT